MIIRGRYRYGCHVPFLGTLEKTVRSGTSPIVKCCQFYVCGNISYSARLSTEDDKMRTMQYCADTGSTFYIHTPLVINLNNMKPKGWECLDCIYDTLEGTPGCMVVHMGKKLGASDIDALENISTSVKSLRTDGRFLLENAAGQGTEYGASWEQVRSLFERINGTGVGLCFDTQHLFASGMIDFTREKIDYMFDELDGIRKGLMKVMHLNDSMTGCGSRVDRHEMIGKGHIWGKSTESLGYLLDRMLEHNVDGILETPSPVEDISSLMRVRLPYFP